jgi:mRNA interferase HicA
MKRADLIRHLENCGCEFLREGSRHTVYVNRRQKKASTIPAIVRYMTIFAAKYVRTWE